MQILRYFLFLCVFAVPSAYAKPNTTCRFSLARAFINISYAEVGSRPRREESRNANPNSLQSARGQYGVLADSPLKNTYLAIIDKCAPYPELYDRILYVLSHLEVEQRNRPTGNYQAWLSFLQKSRAEEISHRLFEGLHVISALRTIDISINLEPARGFFPLGSDGQTAKSMDIETRDRRNKRIIGYTEIKRIGSLKGLGRALTSAIEKSVVAREAAPDAELSAVIYIDTLDGFKGEELILEHDDFNERVEMALRMLHSAKMRFGMELDYIIFAHLELKTYVTIHKTHRDFLVEKSAIPQHP